MICKLCDCVADTIVRVTFEDNTIDETVVCMHCNPMIAAKELIEIHKEGSGEHTGEISWWPIP